MSASRWPIELTTHGPVSAGALAWRRRGELRVTLVAKVSFRLENGAVMRDPEPAPLHAAEEHHRASAMFSVRATSDLVPYLPRAEVLLVGHACSPAGSTATELPLRLVVARGPLVLVNKRVDALGDRIGKPEGPSPAPQPFTKIPLWYERALGGAGFLDNPLGTGASPGREQPLPNLVYPQGPMSGRTAAFGPISASWPARKRLLGHGTRKQLEAPVAALPDDLDDAYFHAAPEDQRFDALDGTEHIVLQGFHPVHTTWQSRLPGARVVARLHRPDGGFAAGMLRADTLFLDTDAETCTVTWRVSFPAHDADLDRVAAQVALEMPGQTLEWPAIALPRVKGPPSTRVSPGAIASFDRTMALDAQEAPPEPSRRSFEGTVVLDPAAPLGDAVARRMRSGGTVPLDGQEPAPPSMPFLASHKDGRAPEVPANAMPIEGAPWTRRPAPHVVAPGSWRETTLVADAAAPAEPPEQARDAAARALPADALATLPSADLRADGGAARGADLLDAQPSSADVAPQPPTVASPVVTPPAPSSPRHETFVSPVAEPPPRAPSPPEPPLPLRPADVAPPRPPAPEPPAPRRPSLRDSLYGKLGSR